MTIRLAVVAAALLLAAPASAAPPPIDAAAYYVLNGATGEVVAAANARERRPVASITKLMTTIVALKRLDPADRVRVHPAAPAIGESTVRLRAGEELPVEDLIEAALIQSANDAAHALALAASGGALSAFVEQMNGTARRFGMTDTHFVNPTGLDAPGHVSSARDATILARHAMRNPLIRRIVARRTATIAGGRRLATWNDLLATEPRVVGVKTGHTAAAGWSQVAAARGDGLLLYATILGEPTRGERNADLAALIRWGLSLYRAAPVVSPERVYARAEVGYGRAPVAVVAPRPVVRSVRVGRSLKERVVVATALELPVRRGQRVGEVRVYERRRLVARSALVAQRAVEEPSIPARVAWYAEQTAKNVWEVLTP